MADALQEEMAKLPEATPPEAAPPEDCVTLPERALRLEQILGTNPSGAITVLPLRIAAMEQVVGEQVGNLLQKLASLEAMLL